MEINLAEVKKFCKDKGYNINQYYMAILSKTFKSYMEKQKSDGVSNLAIPSDIRMILPINMRPPITSLEIETSNAIIGIDIKMKLEQDFSVGIKQSKKLMDYFKNALPKLFGYYYC